MAVRHSRGVHLFNNLFIEVKLIKFKGLASCALLLLSLAFGITAFAADPVVEAARQWNLKFSMLNNNNPPLNGKWEPIHQKIYLRGLLDAQDRRGGTQYRDPDDYPNSVSPNIPLVITPPKIHVDTGHRLIQEEMILMRNKLDAFISDMHKIQTQ